MISKYDVADYLDNEEMIAVYLEEILKDGDPEELIEAIGDVARARSMTKIARETGLSRENLYKQFAKGGNPSYRTVQKVLHAVGVREAIVPYEIPKKQDEAKDN